MYVGVRSGWPLKEVEALGETTATVDFSMDSLRDGPSPLAEGWFIGLSDVEESIFEVPPLCDVRHPEKLAHSWQGDADDPLQHGSEL